MSGGLVHVWRLDPHLVNPDLVDREPLADTEAARVLIERHFAETGSAVAAALLATWSQASGEFTTIRRRATVGG
jgi:glutamate synthase (NADPH/NADH) large chain